MTRIVLAGVAVLDFIFTMDAFPRKPEKYRADGAYISGGGNAANAAFAVSRLGAEARLATRLGEDQVGDMIIAGLQAAGVNTDLARRFEDKKSSFSSIYIDGEGERQIMNFRDNTLSMNAEWLPPALPETFDATLADTRWPDGAASLMRAARQRGVPGILDAEAPTHEATDAINAASHVAFSAQGARDFTELSSAPDAALKAAKSISGKVIVTDGGNGAYAVTDGSLQHYPAYPVAAVDTLGAGDVWHGAFAVALAEQQNEGDAIRFANAAAALKCMKPGGREGAPSKLQVLDLMETSQ